MKNVILYFVLVVAGSVYGQGEPDIIWSGKALREVEPAYRISENPTIIDTVISTSIIDYPTLVLQHSTSFKVDTINAASIKTEPKLTQFYKSYLKLGIGTELMPLGEYYFNSNRSRKYVYGAHLTHLSSFGNFDNYAPAQFDRTGLALTGALNEKKYTVNGSLFYTNQGFNYYGWQIPTDSVDRQTIAQRFQDIGGSVKYTSHGKDSATLNYSVGLDYSNFSSKKPLEDTLSDWRTKENYFAIYGTGMYKKGREVYMADLSVRHNSYNYGQVNDTVLNYGYGISSSNTLVNLSPSISTFLQNNRIKIKVGFDLALESMNGTRVHIYPTIEAKYPLFNDIIIPYAGLRGGIKQQTFKSLAKLNEFMLPNSTLLNEKTPIDFYVGFKGTLTKQLSFNASASFAKIQNKALFVSDTLYSVGNKFNVVYDTLTLSTFEGSLAYQQSEKLKIDGIGRIYSYQLNNEIYAWNLPTWQVILRGSYNLYEKFLINLDVNFEGGRNAKVYQKDAETLMENNQLAQPLQVITDINLGIEYRYTKRISAFIQFNNIASQRYFRWYKTPVQIFQVMGGITARF
ncbi:MAG: hypothetical protein KA521_00265 [Crocinitomicaceae bacterium]|nr:hypothetical protein [Crocinitomicaceae bacterium]